MAMTNAERQAKWREQNAERLKRAREAYQAALRGNEQPTAPQGDGQAGADPPPDRGLSATAQQKMAAAIAARKRRLEREFEHRVNQAAMQWVEEIRIPIYEKKLKEIERMLNRPGNAVMTTAEYKKLLMCVHPDGLKSRTEEQLAEAFRILTKYKPKMVALDDEGRRQLMGGMPRTREELLRRKRTKR